MKYIRDVIYLKVHSSFLNHIDNIDKYYRHKKEFIIFI